MSLDRTALQKRLTRAERKLRLLRKRKSEYIDVTTIPLQLIDQEEQLEEEIANLQARLGLLPETTNPADGLSSVSLRNVEFEGPVFGVPFRQDPNFTGREEI